MTSDGKDRREALLMSRRKLLGAAALAAGPVLGRGGPAEAQGGASAEAPAGQGLSLVSSFLGVNHAVSPGNPNFELADAVHMDKMVEMGVGWERPNVRWHWSQPTRDAELNFDKLGRVLAELKQRGLEAVPIIWNTPLWAGDRGQRSFLVGPTRYTYEPQVDDPPLKIASDPETGEEYYRRPIQFPTALPAANVAEWTRFVEAAVQVATAEPYNVRYFQIWNEPHIDGPFFEGSNEEFVDRVHIPAAKVIRAHGGKVVYGGWPPNKAPFSQLYEVLNYNEMWRWIDILSIHYHPPIAFQWLWEDWVKPGKIEGIWQTEIASGVSHWQAPNEYPRTMFWALQHGWGADAPDKYKLFTYTMREQLQNPPYSDGYDGAGMVYQDDTGALQLSRKGEQVQTLARLLDGATLEAFGGVRFEWPPRDPPQSQPFTLDYSADSIEGFRVDDRLVIAIHLAMSPNFLKPDGQARELHHLHGSPPAPYRTVDLLASGVRPERVREATGVSVRGARAPVQVQAGQSPGSTRLRIDPQTMVESVSSFRPRPPIATFYVELKLH